MTSESMVYKLWNRSGMSWPAQNLRMDLRSGSRDATAWSTTGRGKLFENSSDTTNAQM